MQAMRKKRDESATAGALDQLRNSAAKKGNLMPVIIEALQANATVGEISAALEDVFGRHKETIVI